jgi:Tfp pilus assembly protein PilF
MRGAEIAEKHGGTDSLLASACYGNAYTDAQKLTDLATAEALAQSLLQDSIKTNKKVSIARQILLLAYIQTRAGEIAKANKTYEQGISYCNSNTGLGLILEEYADFLKKQKQPEKAEEVLQKLRSLKSNSH